MLAGSIIFSSAAFAQSGQKYATGGNNLNSNDKLGSKNNAPLRFVTDDNERARISETGFFGIGTTTPNATLTVNGTFKFTDGNQQNGYVLTTDGNGLATWQSLSTNNTGLWQQNGNDIFYNNGNVSAGNDLTVGNRLDVGSFFKAGNDTVEITSNYSAINSGMFCIGGLMGVGGTVPTVALDVKGDFKLSGNAEVQQDVKFSGLPLTDSTVTTQLITIDIDGKIHRSPINLPPPSLSCYPNILWGLNQQNVNTADVILCATNKKVGIGTHTPIAKLHSVGRAYFGPDNGFTNNGFLEVNATVGNNLKAAQFENQNGSRVYIVPQLGGFGFSNLSQQNDIGIIWSDNENAFNQNAGLVFAPHGQKQGMRITKDGDIGIGLSEPEAKLHVEGSTIIEDDLTVNGAFNLNGKVSIGSEDITSGQHTDYKLAVDGKIVGKTVHASVNGWSDFVFDKGYELMSLYEVEQYIKNNQHLPDVPSEKEVMQNGISMAEMDALLLQKIEELTLYVIELKKENQELRELIK